jgi:hypothetical protein
MAGLEEKLPKGQKEKEYSSSTVTNYFFFPFFFFLVSPSGRGLFYNLSSTVEQSVGR